MASAKAKSSLNELRKKKKITTDIIEGYCDIYSQCKEDGSLLDEFKELIKSIMLKSKLKSVAPKDCPYQLDLSVYPKMELNRQKVIESLATQLFGKSFKRNKQYKKLIKKFTKKSIVDKLNEPKVNSNYRSKANAA